MNSNNITETTQYLFFILDDEVYAISSYNVLEVVDVKPIKKVPHTHKCITGVTNIRGELIAVVDPKIRFGNESSSVSKRTSFIIINIFNKISKEEVPIALMVDYIPNSDILDAPEFGTKIEKRFIKNIIKYKDNYVSILKISLVLEINELSKRG